MQEKKGFDVRELTGRWPLFLVAGLLALVAVLSMTLGLNDPEPRPQEAPGASQDAAGAMPPSGEVEWIPPMPEGEDADEITGGAAVLTEVDGMRLVGSDEVSVFYEDGQDRLRVRGARASEEDLTLLLEGMGEYRQVEQWVCGESDEGPTCLRSTGAVLLVLDGADRDRLVSWGDAFLLAGA